MLIEDEHIRNSVDVISEAKLHKGASSIIFDQGLLHHVKNSFKGVLHWPDNNLMFRRVSCNRATSKE
jgi:hypothetical protein